MTSYYTVVHCVPDPFADERMNVGVVVFGDGRIRSRFLRRWDRVEQFAGKEVAAYARLFADRFARASESSSEGEAQRSLSGPLAGPRIDEERLRNMMQDAGNSVQFSPAQSSLREPDDLLAELARVVLVEHQNQPKRLRNRREAADIAVSSLEVAVEERFSLPSAKRLVKPNYEIAGVVNLSHRVDAAVTNGSVYDIVEAFSFERLDLDQLKTDVLNALLGFRDIRDRNPKVGRFDVLALRPRTELDGWRQMDQVLAEMAQACKRAGATLVPNDEANDWAAEVARAIPSNAISHIDRTLLDSHV